MNTRPASAADADTIANMMLELGYPASADELRARLTTLLSRETHFIALAEDASGAVGWIAAEERLLLESGQRAEIVGLVVTAGARRQGVGAKLVGEAEDWARSMGIATIFVRSNVMRVEAHPFYERLGYARTKTQHAYSKRLTAP